MAAKSRKHVKFYPKVEDNKDYARVGAWFLGPKGENEHLLLDSVTQSIQHHSKFRLENYNKDDEAYISENMKETKEYKEEVDKFHTHLAILREKLTKSVPFFTPRYQAHMNWDCAIPATVGYITAMFYNQNNVATEASTVTSQLELEVGQDLCKLMGFNAPEGKPKPWGHITAGGTIANIEAMWVARNLKYLPLAIRMLLQTNEKYSAAKCLKIEVWQGLGTVEKVFLMLDHDELLRLGPDNVLEFLDTIAIVCFGSSESRDKVMSDLIPLTLQYLGYVEFAKKHEIIMRSPKVLAPATSHYSWPKGATILGLGEDGVIGVKVDKYCRMDMGDLKEKIKYCRDNNYTILMVVAVIGSTAEGISDNLFGILSLRSITHYQGMNYLIHVDAAWGGYVRTILPNLKARTSWNVKIPLVDDSYVPTLPLSAHAQWQFRLFPWADSITVDPHKAGYVPYPAGALCYRNGDYRYLINMGAPYIRSDEDLNMGTYGIEGSKPGAAPTACWLAHRSISLDNKGYGLVLGECMFSVKRYYCQWMMLPKPDDMFVISMLHPFPEFKREPFKSMSEEEIKAYIKENIIGKSNREIADNPDSMYLLSEIGPDILINAFVFNFKKDVDTLNEDIAKINEFTEKLLARFSMTEQPDTIKDVDILVMGNEYSSKTYGEVILSRMADELGLKLPGGDYSMKMINSTILNPWPTTEGLIEELTSAFKDGMIEIINEMNANPT